MKCKQKLNASKDKDSKGNEIDNPKIEYVSPNNMFIATRMSKNHFSFYLQRKSVKVIVLLFVVNSDACTSPMTFVLDA